MPFVDSAGARIHWESQGDGTPVLLIMGHLYSSRMWYPLLPALTKTHRAITFDNRGTGDSDTTRAPSIGQFADDACAVLDAAGVERAHIYGVSMGGGIAGEFAIRYPDRCLSLVLGCTMMKTEKTTGPAGAAALMYRLPRWLVVAMLRGRGAPEAYGSNAPPGAVAEDMKILAADRFTMAGVRAQAAAIADYARPREAFAALTMPTLVLHGDEDRAVDVKHGRESAEVIPGARLTIFEGAGHNYLVAANEASTAALLNFFDEVDRGRESRASAAATS